MQMNMERTTYMNEESSGVPRGGFGGFKPPPNPKFRRPSKIVPNSTRL